MNATVPETPVNPLVSSIQAKFNNQVDVQEAKFHFKKVTDEAGNETKRPTVSLHLPIPSIEGIVAILESGDAKQQALLLEAVGDVILANAREIVNENEEISQDTFPMEKLSWEYIANLPKAERRGGGISKDTWEEFGKDYMATMPAITAKDSKKVEMALRVFMNKFAQVKTDKKVLALLRQQLALYANGSPNAEQFAECIEFLDKKADGLIKADSSTLLDALS